MRFTSAVLALVLALIWAVPAPATILFAGGEDLDVTSFGTVSVGTTSGHFRSGYARATLTLTPSNGTDPSVNRILSPTFTANTTVWVHAEYYTANSSGSAGTQVAGLYGSDGVRRLLIRAAANNQVKLSTRNTAGTFVDLVTCTASFPVTATLTKLDWFVNYAVAGSTTLYINGVSLCTFSGDVTTNSVTQLNQVEFAGAGSNVTEWSEIIVSTTDTRDMGLFTCAPQANGTNQTWTGTASNVNPTAINDPSAITTASSNAIAEFTCPSLPSGTFTVPAVTQSARVQVGGSGPQNFRYIARPGSGSTDYDNGSDVLATTSFTSYLSQIWATNPATSTIWTTGDLGAGTNFGLKSRP